jgi:hypothetical protein
LASVTGFIGLDNFHKKFYIKNSTLIIQFWLMKLCEKMFNLYENDILRGWHDERLNVISIKYVIFALSHTALTLWIEVIVFIFPQKADFFPFSGKRRFFSDPQIVSKPANNSALCARPRCENKVEHGKMRKSNFIIIAAICSSP